MAGLKSGLHSPHQTRRTFVVGTALTLAGAGAYVAQPRRAENRLSNVKLESVIPPELGSWRVVDNSGVIVARQDEPIDGYDQVLSRKYFAEGLPDVMLLIAYGSTQGGSLRLHRPETCYPGQGFKLSDFVEVTLELGVSTKIPARSFTASRDDREERLTYWTRISDSFPRTIAQEYRAILGSVAKRVIPDGVLVRISAIGADTSASNHAIAAFFSALIHHAVGARPLLLGNAMATQMA
jgi:EpsI family protein